MSDEAVTVAETVVPTGSNAPRSQAAKKGNVRNVSSAKTKENATVVKYRAKDKAIAKSANLLKTIGDPSRVAILMNLSQGELNVSEVCKTVGILSQPAVSHHLALMKAADVVESERNGKNNVYSLSPKGRLLVKSIKATMADVTAAIEEE